MSRLEHVVAVGHGVKASREAETDTGTLFDLYYRDGHGKYHAMPATYDDNCTKSRSTPANPGELLPLNYSLAREKIKRFDNDGLRRMLEESTGQGAYTRASMNDGAWLLKTAIESNNSVAVEIVLQRFAPTDEMTMGLMDAIARMRDGERYDPLLLAAGVFVKVSTAPMVAKAEIEQILQALATKKFPVSPELIGLATALRDDPNFAGLVGFVQNLVVAASQSQ